VTFLPLQPHHRTLVSRPGRRGAGNPAWLGLESVDT
jgi:hypothetical protein